MQPAGKYLPEAQDTPLHSDHEGRFIFKNPGDGAFNAHVMTWADVDLNDLNITIQGGNGVNNNINGGALSDSWDAPPEPVLGVEGLRGLLLRRRPPNRAERAAGRRSSRRPAWPRRDPGPDVGGGLLG